MKNIVMLVVIGLVGCQTTERELNRPTDETEVLVFDSSKLNIKETFREQSINKRKQTIEHVKFEHDRNGSIGYGRLSFYGTSKHQDKYFYDDGRSLPEILKKWFPDDEFIFSDPGQGENHMGVYETHLYDWFNPSGRYNCIAIRQYLGPVPIDQLTNRKEALGTMLVIGYYCVGTWKSLGDTESVFDAFDVPSRPEEKTRAY